MIPLFQQKPPHPLLERFPNNLLCARGMTKRLNRSTTSNPLLVNIKPLLTAGYPRQGFNETNKQVLT